MASSVRQVPKLFVGNLPWTIGSNELKYYFSKFGHVQSAQVVFDKNTGLSKNFGFVVFSNKQSIENVVKDSSHVLEGNTLKVQPSN